MSELSHLYIYKEFFCFSFFKKEAFPLKVESQFLCDYSKRVAGMAQGIFIRHVLGSIVME
ncbi:hypothetical protein [Bacillus sp. PK3_68]|uniref:hypothetical protein n=1 Tax=Bacillus sp. PK3_68 TaxID=2027408 RepID=UPI000E75C7EA|nr:hypothetical protein [Bacillus sp. PK3_68]RJS58713.1 hypothetical protein CJ483_00365 [Bacillus sp. PK3_68]